MPREKLCHTSDVPGLSLLANFQSCLACDRLGSGANLHISHELSSFIWFPRVSDDVIVERATLVSSEDGRSGCFGWNDTTTLPKLKYNRVCEFCHLLNQVLSGKWKPEYDRCYIKTITAPRYYFVSEPELTRKCFMSYDTVRRMHPFSHLSIFKNHLTTHSTHFH